MRGSAKGRYRHRPQRNNKTGYNGICETITGQGNGRSPSPCFEVHWMGTNTKFCFDTWGGRDRALKVAIDYRRHKEWELERGPMRNDIRCNLDVDKEEIK